MAESKEGDGAGTEADGTDPRPVGRVRGGARLAAAGKNNEKKGQLNLPTGAGLLLAGNTAPTIQLVSSDDVCFSATLSDVKLDTGLSYKALLK